MSGKKFYKNLIQPKQKELRYLDVTQDVKPKFDGPPFDLAPVSPEKVRQGIEMYKKFILETPVFRQQNDRTALFDPIHNRTVPCKNAGVLLNEISKEFFLFVRSEEAKPSVYATRLGAHHINDSLMNLWNYEEKFLAAGVKKKTFHQTMHKINNWVDLVFKHIIKSTTPRERAELVGILYCQYKKYSELSDDGIYDNIAYLFKHFGIQQGDIKKISQRIKRDYIRKGKPQK